MHETNVSREEVLRRMLHLAAGKANDPVKLAYLPEEDRDKLARLDLGCLTEFKRNANGTVEMKYMDCTASSSARLPCSQAAFRAASARSTNAARGRWWCSVQ